ncbi:MAG: TrbG/VirB9 family P-type conjugative transfer protein [Sphingomonadaceae bacterium]|nr:TrbG/VirB9 family P-type conjugative transfer protein [Sphingomonadaceae bacterium]
MRRIAFLIALLMAAPATAAVSPTPGGTDPRIGWIHYDPDQVIELPVTIGYQLAIEFGSDERIENVSIGDSLGWQVTPNRRANMLFVKPMLGHSMTDMSVSTSLRRYTFVLKVRHVGGPGRAWYGLRFEYPPSAAALIEAKPPPPPQPPRDVNHAYSYATSAAGLPTRVFDDGQATYFAFPAGIDLPAIFLPDGKSETLAPVHNRDGFVVVEQLSPRFVLRRGKDATIIVNDGYPAPAGTALTPHGKGDKG